MTRKHTRLVSSWLTIEAHEALIERCNAAGMSISEAVRQAVEAWLEDDNAASPVQSLRRLQSYCERYVAADETVRVAAQRWRETGDMALLHLLRAVRDQAGVALPTDVTKAIEAIL